MDPGQINQQRDNRLFPGWKLFPDDSDRRASGRSFGTTIYFTRAQAGGDRTPGNPYSNLLEIVNPNPEPTNVVLKLFDLVADW